jgi:DNA-binding LytR/AlgR family response regulator
MLNFAICDEDPKEAELTKSRIEEAYGSILRRPVQIFNSGEALLAACGTARFDVVVTEIVLPGISGICAARKLKKLNENAVVIFFTDHGEYAIEGYKARAFRYILKSAPKSTFLHQIKAAIYECRSRNKSILITSQKETVSVRVDEVVYAEIFNRIVNLHTVRGSYSYYARLSQLEEELRVYHFIRIHKSFLVNLGYVQSVGTNYLLLTTGQKLNLSKNYRASVESAFIDYVSGF